MPFTGPADCAGAHAQLRLVAGALRAESDLPIIRIASRAEADDHLRSLTRLAEEGDGCVAALALRGVVQYSLATKRWIPKDAPGQAAGRTWEEAASLSLVRAARSPGIDGAFAAALAMRLLLTPGADLLVMAERWGPDLLERLEEPSYLADTTRHLLRGRLASWIVDPAAAESAFTAYANEGGDLDRVVLELARAQLATGRDDGSYWRAAGSSSEAVLAGLVQDLSFIVDSATIAELRAVSANDRPGWLRRFWEMRDLQSLRPRGTRLIEHYRRLAHARRNYRVLRFPRNYETFELWRNEDAELDDRGLIFVRHGAPDDSAQTAAGFCPNLSWLYRRPGGANLVFHFIAREDADDWRLIETLANAEGGNGATTRLRREFRHLQCREELGLYESRIKLDPVYGRLAVYPSRSAWEDELALTTRSREVGTTTDSHEHRFARPMRAALQAYALFGRRAGGRVLFVVSVQPEAPPADSGGVSLEQRLVLQAGGRAIELDSLRRFHAPEGPDAFLVFLTERYLDPGRWTFGMLLRQSDSAGQLFRGEAEIPDAATDAVALSDILFGGTTGVAWAAPDGVFRLNPLGRYEAGDEVPVYYEIAGVPAGSAIQTTATMEGEGKRVQIGFEDRSDGRVQSMRRYIGTSELEPGRYRLTISVETGSATAVRSTEIVIVDRSDD